MKTFTELMAHIHAYFLGKRRSRKKRLTSFHLDLDEMIQVGLDPTKDLQGANLSAVQFGDRDVAGWDFSGSNMTLADLQEVKNIEKAIFSGNTNFSGIRLPKGVTVTQLIGRPI